MRQGLCRHCIVFVKAHWPHLLLVPPAIFAVTIIHEGAHAVAVWAQGGSVTEFAFVPTRALWGHVSYQFPLRVTYSDFAIGVLPYVAWLTVAGTAALASWLRSNWPMWAGSALFLWC
jgi:hypothetical protein